MPRISIAKVILEVPYGHKHVDSIYIRNPSTGNEKEFDSWEDFVVVKRLNQMSTFEIKFAGIESADRTDYVKEGSIVKIFNENNLILKGRIESVEYESDFYVTIKGYGMEAKMLDWEVDRKEYTTTATNTIINQLCSENLDAASPWIINVGTNTNWGNITFKGEYDNRLRFAANLANTINYDWWVSTASDGTEEFPFNTDYFHIDTQRGSATSVKTFNTGGANQNATLAKKEVDVENLVNYVTCYDDKTEILTENSFKLFKDLTDEDKVATLNPKTGYLEYHKPSARQQYRYNGNLVHIKSKFVDLAITPDHKLYSKVPFSRNNEWNLIPVTKALKHSLYFKKSAKWKGKEVEYFSLPSIIFNPNGRNRAIIKEKKIPIDLWLKFMGWYLSEGCLHKNIKKGYKICIRQVNKENRKEIYNIIKEMGFNPFDIKGGSIQFCSKQLYMYLKQFGKAKDKFVPKFIKDLSSKRIEIFLEALFKGDGRFNKNNGLGFYWSISKKLIDDVSELLLKIGKSCKIKLRKRKNYRCYTLTVNHAFTTIRYQPWKLKKIVSEKYYSNYVYDVTVPNHIIFVRRNGITCWSSNCLGYGDGINQLKTSFYNASATHTTLNETLTSTDTTITLTDATDFDSSGTIRIAEEQITYTGKSNNNLTGCTRGANNTTAKAHPKGVFVEKHVTVANAETGSSIKDNGLKEHTIEDRGLVNDSAAQLLASRALMDYKDAITRITINIDDVRFTGVDIGDTITINDTDTGLATDYRVIQIERLNTISEGEVLRYECSNAKLTFIDEMGDIKKKADVETKYAMGSTVTDNLSEKENLDASTDLDMRFYLPADIIRINKALLSFKLKKFRAYTNSSQTAVGGVAHNHELSGTTSNSTTSKTSFALGPNRTVDADLVIQTTCPSVLSGGTWNRTVFIGSYVNKSGATRTVGLAFLDQNDNTIATQAGNIPDESQVTFIRNETSTNYSGQTVKFDITGEGAAAGDFMGFQVIAEDTHAHAFTGQTTDDESAHNHSITMSFGIYEDTQTDIDVTVTAGVDGSEAAVDTYNDMNADDEQNNIDLETQIADAYTSTGAGWYNVKFSVDKNARIEANLFLKYFVESK